MTGKWQSICKYNFNFEVKLFKILRLHIHQCTLSFHVIFLFFIILYFHQTFLGSTADSQSLPVVTLNQFLKAFFGVNLPTRRLARSLCSSVKKQSRFFFTTSTHSYRWDKKRRLYRNLIKIPSLSIETWNKLLSVKITNLDIIHSVWPRTKFCRIKIQRWRRTRVGDKQPFAFHCGIG